MMMSAEAAAEHPLSTDDAIEERVAELVGAACSRQLWLLFLDDEDRQLPTVAPISDYPAGPGGGAAEKLAASLADATRQTEAAQIILVWERRLGDASIPADRLWAAALDRACRDIGVRVRAHLISHAHGVRLLTPSEYGDADAQTSEVSGSSGSAAHSLSDPS